MPSFTRSHAVALRCAAKPNPGEGLDRIRWSAIWRSIVATALLGSTAACSWLPFASRSIPDCPGVIRSTDEIPGDFSIRERVMVESARGNFPFELIVQKKRRELVLIGLSPMGAKLFSIVQAGTETDVDALPGAVLPIPPLNVLRDLHRLRFSEPNTEMSRFGSASFDREGCGYSIRFETLSVERLP